MNGRLFVLMLPAIRCGPAFGRRAINLLAEFTVTVLCPLDLFAVRARLVLVSRTLHLGILKANGFMSGIFP